MDKGSAKIPVNTTVQLQNADSDNHPIDMAYPVGSVNWYVNNPTYTFQVSAGGKLDYENEKPYQIELLVDGKSHGVANTDINSTIKVILSPQASLEDDGHVSSHEGL